MTAWYEDDRFWTDCYRVLYHEGRWAAAAGEVEAALGLLDVEPGASVLDACCGPGRHCLELARRGFRVTGVDRTGPYLEIARGRAEQEGLQVAFVRQDLRTLSLDATFDAAVSMYTSFGYFEDPQEDRAMLQRIAAHLKPGGRLLMDVSGKEVVARLFQARSWSEPAPGLTFLEERRPVEGWERIENRWLLIHEGQTVERRFRVRLYSGIELQAVMLSAGFEQVSVHGNLGGGPYDESARRLVAVGTV